MPFRDLIGQRAARTVLQGALRNGRIVHTYLFVGPAGTGRRAAARAFAQTLLCQAGRSGSRRGHGDDACGECAACRKVERGTHPDLRSVAPGGRTEGGAERRAVGIDQIRELRREAAYGPYEARWKVFIIEDAEAMRAEAANSLLKVLEEPPSQSVIVLLAESTAAVLPTIVSRAQIVRFVPVPAAEIVPALTARGVPADRARYLAAIAGGHVGRALEAAGAGDAPFEWRKTVVKTLADAVRGGLVARLEAAEAVARARDDVDRWLDTVLLWLRDVAVWQAGRDPAVLVNLDAQRDVAVWADRADPAAVCRAVEAVEQAKADIRRNANPRLVLEYLLARMDLRAQPATGSGRARG